MAYDPVRYRPPLGGAGAASSAAQARRRVWPFVLPLVAVVLLAAVWSAFWYSSAALAEKRIAGWLAREASLGRDYSCGSQTLGGYPFRLEVRCRDASAELRNLPSPLSIKARDLLIAAQVYQPALLIGEIAGPVTIAEPARQASMIANWSLAQTSLRGRPRAPERVSLVLDDPVLDRSEGGVTQNLLRGKHIELHAGVASRAPSDRPALHLALRTTAATAPTLHPLLADPLDAEIATVWHGIGDLTPKPWPLRLRELQAAGGRIEVGRARVVQGEVLAVAAGTLRLTSSGHLDGDLQVTVAGLEKVLPALGIDRLMRPGKNTEKIGQALNALDQMLPGLGKVARDHAGLGVAAGVVLLGKPAELEGRKAVTLPLRFAEGVAYLGPVKLGETPPLF